MKRKYGAYAVSAYNGYKRARTAYKSIRSKFTPRTNAARAGRTSNVTTVQKDVSFKKSGKRTSKKTIAKQKAFRSKIEKALSPLATHHTYNEQNTNAVVVTRPVTAASPVTEQYTSTSQQEVYALNNGRVNPNGVTYIVNALHTLLAQGPNLSTGAQVSTNTDFRTMTILSSEIDLSLTNPSNIAMVYDVYWCVATNSFSDANYATPRAAMNTILFNQNTLSSAVNQYDTLNGVQPKDCVGFGKWWKVLTKERVYLSGGSTSEFTFKGGAYTYNSNKFEDMVAVKGMTKCLLVIGGVGDNTGLASGAAAMRLLTTRRYRLKYPQGQDKLPALPTGSARFV